VQLVSDDLLVLACELVGTVDALRVPVCPVKAILKYRDGKWMGQAWMERVRQRELDRERNRQIYVFKEAYVVLITETQE
jgi:hypothetical protein